ERKPAFPILRGSEDVLGIYTILYRYLFDRHRDLGLPISFLINAAGEIVKISQTSIDPEQVTRDLQQIPKTPAERIAKGLPFTGVSGTIEFRRNYLSYGSAYFQREYFDQAESAFRLALNDDPTSAEALYGIGSVYLKQQKKAEAREAFDRATKLRPSYTETLPNAWNNLGLLEAGDGHTADAITDFQKALQLSPDHTIDLNNIGNAYRQGKRWEEAKTAFERALKINAEDADANYGLAMVYAANKDSDRAYEYLEQALTS